MQWKSDSQTSSPPEFFFADAPSGGRDAWLREMWEFFGKTVVPLNTTVGWDYVYVEVAAEVGRILVYPASSATPNRVEKAGCCVQSADLQSKYEALEALDEDAFEAGLTTEVEQLAKEILASSVALRACGEGLPPNLPIKVWEPAEDAPTAEGSV